MTQLSDITFDKNTMLWGSADGKDVHLITLKTEKLEAIKGSRFSLFDLMKISNFHLGGNPKIGVPQNGWFLMENPIRMDDLQVPLFSETSICLHKSGSKKGIKIIHQYPPVGIHDPIFELSPTFQADICSLGAALVAVRVKVRCQAVNQHSVAFLVV